MLEGLRKLVSLVDTPGRFHMLGLLLLGLLAAAFEIVGVTATLPFMALAGNPDLLQRPGHIQRTYMALGEPGRETFLTAVGALVLAALTLSNLLLAISMALGLSFAHRQQRRLSNQLFRSLLGQDYLWHTRRQAVWLWHTVAQSRTLVETNFQPLLSLVSRVCSVATLVLTLMWFRPLATALGLSLVVGLYASVYLACRRQMLRACQREWNLSIEMGRTASEPLGGVKHVKLASTEGNYLRRYDDQLDQLSQAHRQRWMVIEIPRLVMHTLTYGSMLGLVIFLVSRYGGGSQVVGQAAMFALAGYRLVPGVQQVFTSLAQLEAGRPVLENVYENLRSLPAGGCVPSDPPSALPIQHSIALENVTFGYNEAYVFRGLNLHIPRNACIGLAGFSGRGKTTLVNLLVGLLQPQEGRLLVDGQPLTSEQLRGFGRNIGYVPQDVFICDDSILNNIALGGDTFDLEAAEAAARAARVDEFALELPDGYHSQVGERGICLSGGQRQRLGIARALYRNPELLVLDEATSALDAVTEAQVMASIRALAQSRTIVIVAHRLTTLANCDQVHVVDSQGIVASGSYQELVKSCPEFQSLADQRELTHA